MKLRRIREAINSENELLLKVTPLPETDIFAFMQSLRGGTYFNMGMCSSIPLARAYKKTFRIYKVIDLAAIVSGVNYEHIKTTMDYRDATGTQSSGSYYHHMPGYENKVGVKNSDENVKYVLWDIKKGTNTCVRYYLVDVATQAVTPIKKDDIMKSDYITQTEKNKLQPRPVTGYNLTTGALVTNETQWRVAKFENIFWLSQGGENPRNFGTKFTEAFKSGSNNALTEGELFMDGGSGFEYDLDALLSGEVEMSESMAELDQEMVDDTNLEEDLFMDAHADMDCPAVDDLIGEALQDETLAEENEPEVDSIIDLDEDNTENTYADLANNELFIDFD